MSEDGEKKLGLEKKKPKSTSKKLVCRFTIKEDDKKFRPGDVYTGDRREYLLARRAVVEA